MTSPNESEKPDAASVRFPIQLSLDWWAVIAALVLVILVLINILPTITW